MTEATTWDFGESVTGYHWASTSPRGTVLLQHGYGEYAERFVDRYDRFIPTLLDRGFDVYAFDLPGHGWSSGQRGTVDVLAAAEIHRAAKNALAARGPVLLYGHSLGGLITAHTLVDDPSGVSGAVLSSAALPLDTGWWLRSIANVLSAIAPTAPVPLRRAPTSSLARDPGNAEIIAADPLMYRGGLTNRTAHTALRTVMDVWRLAPQCMTPALILHGTADLSTDPKGSERLAAHLAGPDVALELVPDGRHELLNDTDRRHTRDLVLSWLERHDARSMVI